MYLGAHMSISKGYSKAVEAASSIGANTFQFFTRNPRGAGAKALDLKDVEKAYDLAKAKDFGPLVAHAPYIINLASPKQDLWELAIRVVKEDLERLAVIGAPYLTIHPGSHVGSGIENGVNRIAEGINKILTGDEKTFILLEGMAGVGTEIGFEFKQLAQIIKEVDHREKMGVCLDTAHLFGAGYDVKNSFDGVLEEFDKLIGIDRLKAFHINDSLQPLGSRKDRHASIGEGQIGFEALAKVIKHPALKEISFILETPGELEDYKREIEMLRNA